VECGGDGDCFYHSVLFLAELFVPELLAQCRSHQDLRQQVCEYANTNYASMRWPLQQTGTASMPFVDMLAARSSSPDRPAQDIVASFINTNFGPAYYFKASLGLVSIRISKIFSISIMMLI
jgi:hypothetical protein